MFVNMADPIWGPQQLEIYRVEVKTRIQCIFALMNQFLLTPGNTFSFFIF